MAFCPNCGVVVTGNFCTSCGAKQETAAPSETSGATSAAAASASLLQINIGGAGQRRIGETSAAAAALYPPPLTQAQGNAISEHLVRRWNWGAFLLPWLWPFWHGITWMGVVALICAIFSFWVIPAFVVLGFAVYLGIKGNEIAVQRRLYGEDETFLKVEGAWTKGGVIALLASIPAGIILAILGFFAALISASPRY